MNLKKEILVFAFILSLVTGFTQVNSTLVHDGITRTFVYYTPTNWTSGQNVPLLILMHGLTQTGAGVMDITQFNAIAEQDNFIVVYPDGLNFAWNANMNITVSTADDIGFIESLAQYFQTNFGTDPLRQYLVGFSNGGFMSHKIACESSMCFAGIATVAGNMSDTTYSNCSPQHLPAVLHIHGTADAVVPYNGGAGTGVSVDQVMSKWRGFLSCSLTPMMVAMPNTNLLDLSSPQRITYQNCMSPLELIKITGGGHQWPGIQTLIGGAGTINLDFYSPQLIWDFLKNNACPLNALNKPELSIPNIQNPVQSAINLDGLDHRTYQLYTMTGEQITEGMNETSVDISSFSDGIYLLKLNFPSFTAVVRIMKEN
jgi:polyhydroxybutyrate depolymerase